MLKCRNVPAAIVNELRKHISCSSVVIVEPSDDYDDFDILKPIQTIPVKDQGVIVYVSWPTVLGTVEPGKHDVIRLCHLNKVTFGHKRKREMSSSSVSTLMDSLEELYTKVKPKEGPFPHGYESVNIPQVGKEKFETIMQCYYLLFKKEKVYRLIHELERIRLSTMTDDEIEIFESVVLTTWEKVKKEHLNRSLNKA